MPGGTRRRRCAGRNKPQTLPRFIGVKICSFACLFVSARARKPLPGSVVLSTWSFLVEPGEEAACVPAVTDCLRAMGRCRLAGNGDDFSFFLKHTMFMKPVDGEGSQGPGHGSATGRLFGSSDSLATGVRSQVLGSGGIGPWVRAPPPSHTAADCSVCSPLPTDFSLLVLPLCAPRFHPSQLSSLSLANLWLLPSAFALSV